MKGKYVTTYMEENIAIVTIDKPPVNAINPEVTRELSLAFDELRENEKVRAVILTGAGKAFVAGAEIKNFPGLNRKSGEAFALNVTDMQRKIEEFNRPVIAAIDGYALGGGCELVLACDIRVASKKAKLGLPEVTLGLIPGAGGTQRLARLIPVGKAKKMIFTGEIIDADEAERIGLVDLVTEPGEALAEAKKLAGEIVKNAPVAVGFAKKAINRGLQMGLNDAVLMEASFFGELFETADVKEGVSAFFEKRPPEFKGE